VASGPGKSNHFYRRRLESTYVDVEAIRGIDANRTWTFRQDLTGGRGGNVGTCNGSWLATLHD
jgi:hypothetical protein